MRKRAAPWMGPPASRSPQLTIRMFSATSGVNHREHLVLVVAVRAADQHAGLDVAGHERVTRAVPIQPSLASVIGVVMSGGNPSPAPVLMELCEEPGLAPAPRGRDPQDGGGCGSSERMGTPAASEHCEARLTRSAGAGFIAARPARVVLPSDGSSDAIHTGRHARGLRSAVSQKRQSSRAARPERDNPEQRGTHQRRPLPQPRGAIGRGLSTSASLLFAVCT